MAPTAWPSTSRSCWAACSDGDARRLSNSRASGAEVDRQRVDEHDAAGPGDLHQGQAREVRLLAVELGVDGVPRLGDHCRRRSPGRVVVDPRLRGRSGGRAHERLGASRARRDVVARTIHAIVPPATLTTLDAVERRTANSHARMLRAPDGR